jgi:hypothetical protein
MNEPPTIVRTTVQDLQRRFNEGKYWERLRKGEYTAVLLEDRHPSLIAANEPFCTRSQMVSYIDRNNNEIARVHQYLRPDGSIGASGKPDPKRLLEGNMLYRLKTAKGLVDQSNSGPKES